MKIKTHKSEIPIYINETKGTDLEPKLKQERSLEYLPGPKLWRTRNKHKSRWSAKTSSNKNIKGIRNKSENKMRMVDLEIRWCSEISRAKRMEEILSILTSRRSRHFFQNSKLFSCFFFFTSLVALTETTLLQDLLIKTACHCLGPSPYQSELSNDVVY